MIFHSRVRIDLVSLLAACTLFLSTIEYIIPKPVPFMRLGLANIPLLIALGLLTKKEYVLLAIMKVLGHGLVTGTLFSYIGLFSGAGTAASALIMYVLYRIIPTKYLSVIGISVAGALGSNVVQLLLSSVILFGRAAYLLAPPFLIIGLISSFMLGVITQRFIASSKWYEIKRGSS